MTRPTEPQGEPRVPFEMTDIPSDPESQAKRGWEVYLNDELVDFPIRSIRLVQTRMGVTAEYAMGPQKYDQIVLKEPGGGGAITVPYLVDPEGQIFIGMVHQYRPLIGGVIPNAPRGFFDPNNDANHSETAENELGQETNLREMGKRIVPLAHGINPNTAFSDTSATLPDGSPAGISTFAVRLETDEVVLSHKEDGTPYYRFPDDISEEAKGHKVAEDIVGSEFVPLEEAMKTNDGMTKMAVGDLFTSMVLSGDYIVPQKRAFTSTVEKDELVNS